MKVYVLCISDTELRKVIHCSVHHGMGGAIDAAVAVAASDEDDDVFGEWRGNPRVLIQASNSYLEARIELKEVQS